MEPATPAEGRLLAAAKQLGRSSERIFSKLRVVGGWTGPRSRLRACGRCLVSRPGGYPVDDRQLVKALAEYRQGSFASAVEWARKASTQPGSDNKRDVQDCMVLARANHRLQLFDSARAAFAEGVKIAEAKLPKLGRGNLGPCWDEVF
jgi:hypothetical protein